MKINDYYKKVTGSHVDKDGNFIEDELDIFDYEKIYKSPFKFVLIISERGLRAKTTQAKFLANKIFSEEKKLTMWMMNTQPQIDKEIKSHLKKPRQFLKGFDDCLVTKNGVYKGKDMYTKFTTLSTAENEKGSRDDYGLWIYDEFNVGNQFIKGDQTDLFISLLGTLTDPINAGSQAFSKIIVHGNNKSFNNKLIIDLGIFSVTKQVTEINDSNGNPLILILCPIPTEKEKKSLATRLNYDFAFNLAKRLDKVDHMYYNFTLNSIQNVFPEIKVRLVNEDKYKINYLFHSKKQYLAVIEFFENGKRKIFVENLKIKDVPIDQRKYAIKAKDVEEGIQWLPEYKSYFFVQLGNNNIFYSSQVARELFISMLV